MNESQSILHSIIYLKGKKERSTQRKQRKKSKNEEKVIAESTDLQPIKANSIELDYYLCECKIVKRMQMRMQNSKTAKSKATCT